MKRKRPIKYRNLISNFEPTSTFRAELKIQTRYEIIRIIQSSRNGITHGELARRIRIDRKNLRPYMKELLGEQFIIRGEGKRGKYFLGPEFADARFASFLLPDMINEQVLNADYLIVNKYLENPTHKNYKDFRNYLPNFLTDERLALKRSIFEFSSKIGSIITYLTIQSLNPNVMFKVAFPTSIT